MANELPERKEVDNKFKWNLNDIYSSDKKWEEDYRVVENLLTEIKEYQGNFNHSAKKVYELIELLMQAREITSRLYAYAHMKKDQDTRQQENQALFNKAQNISNKLANASSFIKPELLELSHEKIKEYINEYNDLKLYEQYLEDIIRKKEHYLSKSEEKIMAMANDISQGPENIFSILNNADLKFPIIKDENGEEQRLTHGRFIKFMKSKDRRVRKDAFNALYETYDDFINTYAATLNSEVKTHVFNANARKYNSSLEAALDEDNVPVEVYNNLIEAVNENLDSMHKYVKLRKEILNLEELHIYDIYTPLVQELDLDIEFEEAKETVISGLQPLGEEYINNLKNGFSSSWIDVYENKGKRSGAYSSGCYGIHPYVMLNYSGNISDMFTLAHEMGHALHTYYSNKNQPFVYANYKIFVAEVASTLNEALLIHYLLENTDDKKKRKYLINHYLEQFKGTVFRQTMFAEFEKDIHEKVEADQPLTADSLNNIYHKLNEKYFGDEMVVDENIDKEWARIPHFYYNFYVYKYATGFSAAQAISKKIIEEGEEAVNRYLDFLKSGNSDYPINVLKKAGVDMTSPQPISTALGIFNDLVNELEELSN
ncbi:MAG: oligoendopeptidase F [Bacillota bacterium]